MQERSSFTLQSCVPAEVGPENSSGIAAYGASWRDCAAGLQLPSSVPVRLPTFRQMDSKNLSCRCFLERGFSSGRARSVRSEQRCLKGVPDLPYGTQPTTVSDWLTRAVAQMCHCRTYAPSDVSCWPCAIRVAWKFGCERRDRSRKTQSICAVKKTLV